MSRFSLWSSLALLLFVSGCTCAQLPDAVFQCEPDGTCAQPGFMCGDDGLCRSTNVTTDGGRPDSGTADAGEVDAGEVDAGEVDAGNVDAGETDAGETDAGEADGGELDAGDPDSGTPDAGMPDAGTPDSGTPDSGTPDAGTPDAGTPDAGTPDAGCIPGLGVDEPDRNGIDLNCDGFDGDLSRAVFVDFTNGLDTNSGLTRSAPKKTLGSALATGRTQVYLATGAAHPASDLSEAFALYGGYTASGAWPRTSMHSAITGAMVAQPLDGGRIVLDLVDVTTGDSAAGAPSIALTLIGSAGAVLQDVRLTAGRGGAGTSGASAPPVADGNAGGAGAAGDLGGVGGNGGVAASCDDAGVSAEGFIGGHGAFDSTGVGTNGSDTTFGGPGGEVLFCDGGCVGFDGGEGTAASDGAMSAARPADPPSTFLGSIVANTWLGAQLGTWTPAGAGRAGGGGGGGGGIVDELLTLIARGGGAGGGGSGGCGGRSGGAGGPGGASIALLLIDSSPTLRNVTLTTLSGGAGGPGGAASSGGMGGAGGPGAVGETTAAGTAGSGAPGGRGGQGGPGRQGPGGWGGPVIGLFCSGASAPTLDATTTWIQMGSPGAAGTGDPAGRAGGTPPTGFSTGCP
jgi:hypothetical protein